MTTDQITMTDPKDNPYEGTPLAPIWANLRLMVRSGYDFQKIRISIGNRIAAQFRSKAGLKPADKLEKMKQTDEESDKILKMLKASYKRLTDGLVDLPQERAFKGDKLITEYAELVLVHQYMEVLRCEESQFSRLQVFLKKFPIYNEFLKDVKGCGPMMAGVIISELNIRKATYVSSLWSYCGYDTGPDGKGRSRRQEHLVDRQYIDKKGNVAVRKSITFNPLVKTKLSGVLGPSFLRSKSAYAQSYYDYKQRLENHPDHQEKTPGHRHNMAIRYMVKRFLADLYVAWKTADRLPVHPEYSEAKLGIIHKKQRPAS